MLAVGETPAPYQKSRLLDRVRDTIRARHYSRQTEKAYVGWIRRCIIFHGKRHPAEMGAPEMTAFLTSLAVDSHVALSTENQALPRCCSSIARCSRKRFRGWMTLSAPSDRSGCRSC